MLLVIYFSIYKDHIRDFTRYSLGIIFQVLLTTSVIVYHGATFIEVISQITDILTFNYEGDCIYRAHHRSLMNVSFGIYVGA